jgi:hypothetical protein
MGFPLDSKTARQMKIIPMSGTMPKIVRSRKFQR